MSRQAGWAAVCETGRIKHTRTANEFVRLPTHKKCYPGCDNASRLIAFLVNADYGPSNCFNFCQQTRLPLAPIPRQSPSEAEMTGPERPESTTTLYSPHKLPLDTLARPVTSGAHTAARN